ncbi:hypothetical protein LCGC14_1370990, partial [marine sediment metagenome]
RSFGHLPNSDTVIQKIYIRSASIYNGKPMPCEEEKLARARRTMIRVHLEGRGITNPRVLEAFRRVPRERFVPAKKLRDAYADHPIPIGRGQTISQPYIVALMIQELDVQPSDRVLDVGSGSGYETALLAGLS